MTAHCITTQFYMIFLLQGLLSTTFVVDVLFRSGSDGEEETKSLFVKVPLRGPEAAIYDSVSHKSGLYVKVLSGALGLPSTTR